MRKASCFCLVICYALGASGQTATPVVQSRMVSVPILVEGRSGESANDLSATDFSIKDNGVEQRVELESKTHSQPLSLLLVIQTGRNAPAELGKIARLDDLLDSILTNRRDQVAILTFDSRPRLVQDFTSDSDPISHSLSSIAPGDKGAALFDALHVAVALFSKAPLQNRRVILLISGEHDHGSDAPDAASLIRGVSSRDVSVYSLTFAPPKKELPNRPWSMNPLSMAASAMQENAAETLTKLTGGDFYRFDSKNSFDEGVGEMANHIHNRYCLTFQPRDPGPGFHSLLVEVRRPKANVVSARSGYWFSPPDGTGSGSPR